MSTLQKMLSEIRELDASEWDHVGGMGTSGPTSENILVPTTSPVAHYTGADGKEVVVVAQDDGDTYVVSD